MLTFREIQNCEGYYYNRVTGDVLRNVGPGLSCCWSEGVWEETGVTSEPDAPQYEWLTGDVMLPFVLVEQEVLSRYGGPQSGRVVNRQTAVQPDGGLRTEEASTSLPDLGSATEQPVR